MKKILFVATLFFTAFFSQSVFAQSQLSYSGGITEGIKLPKTTEQLLVQSTASQTAGKTQTLSYKEVLFLSGKPDTFEGTLTLKSSSGIPNNKNLGTYTETYQIAPLKTATTGAASKTSTIIFTVNWRRVAGTTQIIKDYELKSWAEQITTGGKTYVLDPKKSAYSKSIIEEKKPGAIYTKGNISGLAVYNVSGSQSGVISMDMDGDVYACDTVWSNTETQRLNVVIDSQIPSDIWQLQVQVRPSVSVNKVIQYSKNEPTAISFDGNYYEVMKNQSILEYTIYQMPKKYEDLVANEGSISIATRNTFEQLHAPENLGFLKGNFAQTDISKLFSMQVLTGSPTKYIPNQAMTRAQFAAALVKAVKVPIAQPATTSSTKKSPTIFLFADVNSTRSDFYYIQAAYNAGIAVGQSNGKFNPDVPITRQEAIAMLINTLGLSNLGMGSSTGMTKFIDNAKIAPWAKSSVSAAEKIGLIRGDTNGAVRPQDKMTKAESAAFINNFVNYLRSGITKDYSENIVNYAN